MHIPEYKQSHLPPLHSMSAYTHVDKSFHIIVHHSSSHSTSHLFHPFTPPTPTYTRTHTYACTPTPPHTLTLTLTLTHTPVLSCCLAVCKATRPPQGQEQMLVYIDTTSYRIGLFPASVNGQPQNHRWQTTGSSPSNNS